MGFLLLLLFNNFLIFTINNSFLIYKYFWGIFLHHKLFSHFIFFFDIFKKLFNFLLFCCWLNLLYISVNVQIQFFIVISSFFAGSVKLLFCFYFIFFCLILVQNSNKVSVIHMLLLFGYFLFVFIIKGKNKQNN